MIDIDELLDIQHHFGGGVYAKQANFNPGDSVEQHVHEYDHLSIMNGHVLVEVDGVQTEYRGTHCILIEAGKRHKVTAVTKSIWFCVHATNETDPAKVDEVILKKIGEK